MHFAFDDSKLDDHNNIDCSLLTCFCSHRTHRTHRYGGLKESSVRNVPPSYTPSAASVIKGSLLSSQSCAISFKEPSRVLIQYLLPAKRFASPTLKFPATFLVKNSP